MTGRRPEEAESGRVVYALPGGDWLVARKGTLHPGVPVLLVAAGAVDLVRAGRRRRGAVAQVTSGGSFGELAPLLGIRRSATARAARPTEVLGLTPAEFRRRRAAGRSAGSEAPTGAGSPSAP